MATKKPITKRGRPKSSETLERERMEALLKNPPTYIPPMTKKDKQWWNDFINNSEEAQHAILEGCSPLLPHSLIYDLESLGDESMHGVEKIILDKFATYKNKETTGRINGADETASQADVKAKRLWAKNSALVRRIQSGNLMLNSASKIIFDDWENKGIEGGRPSLKTISNWYKRIRPN
ncbi:hypothetical protein [Polynucleobacter sphagniphilus]|uniref:hypothetical protein n=1 Tax=Polynucleobacter sphagniphilus TaxID=1743169 RepID=UPI00247457E4|nr:hypothetical protein [Polynucleobacter sphagniphilus]MDH6300003.1 hypothetical protein [Polynucleobacter sphagniphilus]